MGKKTSATFISSYYAFAGIFFLFSSARDVFNHISEIEWVMFLCIGIGMFLSFYVKTLWIAYYHYVLILFYNPLILSQITTKDSFIADIVIGISFFLIGLHWDKFASTRNKTIN
jgi:hypothetical protein